ncbi:sensor histidine kinase LiaS [Oxobacter pfennigii]|uniref:histidine kinase n=1 Tax=Oxobacter pfennigii TaxID=36849 RepID=A0A0P8W8C9_9CLOT|nr:sensor histidine kinase [Oxobacter pfennigii]KPU44263.1 sensor histidine kinase LiaS [Oxobacter pfennigii]
MEKRQKLFLYLLKTTVLTILFFAAVYFENAQQQRLFVLAALFILYLLTGFARCFINRESSFHHLSFILDIAFVYILEQNSRLLINYTFHTFYISIILEAVLLLEFKRGMIIGAAAVLISMIKYGYLIYYRFSLSNISQMAFFMMVNVLVLLSAGFAKHNREEKRKKDILYTELLDAHKRLKRYIYEVNRLTVVEERNRIARDIHDTLGHNMTALIMQLQMAEHFLNENASKVEKMIVDAKATARDSLSGIREVVETLRGSDTVLFSLKDIKNLVREFSQKTGTGIKLDINGEDTIKCSAANMVLYRILQEAMTNSIRHGKASCIQIKLDYAVSSVEFYVIDNGVGAEDIKEGFGIKGIKERVAAFGGEVEFGGNNGFYIKGILYLEGENDKSTVG